VTSPVTAATSVAPAAISTVTRTPTRTALAAAAELRVDPGPGRQQLRWSQAWPVVLRATGPDRVHLVHGAGGPLGGDEFSLDVAVAAGAVLRLRSAASTIVQPAAVHPGEVAAGPAHWTVTATVGVGGLLDWAPEPTVVCTGAAIESRLHVRVAAGAGAVLREVAVLGRHGERGGRYRGEVLVEVDGEPLLAHTTVLDGQDDALAGPGGTAGARAVGTLVFAGAAAPALDAAGEEPGVRWASMPLPGPGRMLVAVGDPARVGAILDRYAAVANPAGGGAVAQSS
jgi:urease accessory protein